MKFQKSIITALAGAVLIATPVVAANASSLPSKSSSYWNKARVVTTTKKVTASEHKIIKKGFSKKVLKKIGIKKGTKIYVTHVKGNVWKITGVKTAKNTVLTTTQAKTTWMKQAAKSKKTTTKQKTEKVTINTNKNIPLYTVTKKTKLYRFGVKNNIIQTNKVLQKSSIDKNKVVFLKKLNNGYWVITGGNYPAIKKGVWVVKNTKANWIKQVPVYTTSKKTVPSNDIDSKKAQDAYFALNQPIKYNNTILHFGDAVKAQKISDTVQILYIDGKSVPVSVSNNQPYAIASNTLILKLSNGANGLQSLYTPGDSRVILPKTYTPANGDEWFQYHESKGNYSVYKYVSSLSGWLYSGEFTPKAATTTTNSGTTNSTSTTTNNSSNSSNTTTKK